RRAEIAMPGDAIDVLGEVWVLKFVRDTAPQVVIVIEDPDFCVERVLLERRPEKLLYELDLVLLPPHALGHAPTLVGVDLVLNGDGANVDSIRGIALEKLHKVLRIRPEILASHGT